MCTQSMCWNSHHLRTVLVLFVLDQRRCNQGALEAVGTGDLGAHLGRVCSSHLSVLCCPENTIPEGL